MRMRSNAAARRGRRALRFGAALPLILLLAACAQGTPAPESAAEHTPSIPAETPAIAQSTPTPWITPRPTPYLYIDEAGDTVQSRFRVPPGFTRVETDGYGTFLREQRLLPHGSPILLYNGEEGAIQDWHAAVLDVDVGTRDLQQCADAALRLRCEYLFSAGEYQRIQYNLTNGYPFPYAKWREGYRLGSNKASMVKSASRDESYDSFRKYLDALFNYASTRSLAPESETVPVEALRVGDILIRAGSPGHCVIILDLCENEAGVKAALLAQSSMPAQSIHVISDPHRANPWVQITEEDLPLQVMIWEFAAEDIKRMP